MDVKQGHHRGSILVLGDGTNATLASAVCRLALSLRLLTLMILRRSWLGSLDGLRNVGLVRAIDDLIGDYVVRGLRLKLQDFLNRSGNVRRVLGLRFRRWLRYPLVLGLLLGLLTLRSLTLLSGSTLTALLVLRLVLTRRWLSLTAVLSLGG